jgi:hypothetical protein
VKPEFALKVLKLVIEDGMYILLQGDLTLAPKHIIDKTVVISSDEQLLGFFLVSKMNKTGMLLHLSKGFKLDDAFADKMLIVNL